jgi:hypothetical protein
MYVSDQPSLAMPDTGERREITGRVNAKEAEVVQQSKKLASKTRQLSAKMDAKNRERKPEPRVKGRPDRSTESS